MIRLAQIPKRIVSLVPSQTELLYDLGLDGEVSGITKFCVHPHKWFKSKKRVGGTKTVNIAAVEQLMPDLVLANKEENVKEQIEAISKIAPVWISDVHNLTTALDMVKQVGTICGKGNKAVEITSKTQELFQGLPAVNRLLRSAYLVWREPFMAAGSGTLLMI